MRYRFLMLLLLFGCWCGCGTTKWSDTSRTATEQLLISDSVDRAVSQIDFRAIAGKTVYLDDTYIKNVTDTAYLVSSLRQHVLASGAVLREKREEADYVVEVRAGAVGTDRHDVLFGIPQTTIPMLLSTSASSTTIPEIAFAKRTNQRAVTKVAVFAYNRQTGRPLWQSGAVPSESKAKAVWIVGAGPFQQGSIYQGTKFAGAGLNVNIPLIDPLGARDTDQPKISVAEQAYFAEPHEDRAHGLAVHALAAAKAATPSAPATRGAAPAASSSSPGNAAVGRSPEVPPASSSPGNAAGRSPEVPPAVTALPETAPAATPSQGPSPTWPAVPSGVIPTGANVAEPFYPSTDNPGSYPSTDPLPYLRR